MQIVILGNGIAGVTAARHLRKRSNNDILLVSDESDEFFSRTALMYIYMGHMREKDTRPYENWFWGKNRIQRKRARISRADFNAKELIAESGERISYDILILATGSKSNKFGWPGQDLDGVGGLYHLQDLEQMEKHSEGLKRAVIVGGGLIGIEMAEMFHSRHIPVTFLVREASFWNGVLPAEESAMITRHIRQHGIDLQLETNLKEIIDNGNGKCRAVKTDKAEAEIPCGYVGLTAGVSPNISFLKDSGLETGRGILVDEYLKTNLPDVYAIGDCAELRNPPPGRKNIEAVWYCGRMMGETVAHTITGNTQVYQPGIWFNSAKFLDIEYQVYGDITATTPSDIATLYWEHLEGDKSIRINFEMKTGAVTGFNLMGVRFRHEVCEKWIREKTPVEQVLASLPIAHFDPEFSATYARDVVDMYNKQTGRSVRIKEKTGLRGALAFLNN